MLEQDDERLTVPTENIRRAVRETAKHVIRLFKQFATQPRLMRLAGEGQTEVFIFSASDITSDDVVFETDNELSFSPSQRRASIMELISSGLLAGEDGRIPGPVKDKLLELLGYGALVGTGQGTTLVAGDKKEQNQTVREGEADCSGEVA